MTGHRSDFRQGQRKRHGLWCPILALIGLYSFSSSFFLAKRSMPHMSSCNEAQSLLHDTLGLTNDEIAKLPLSSGRGCWNDRLVDSLVVIVVDALRFDFALHHLPISIGSRLMSDKGNATTTHYQLLRFVADPPTVTMQRLKGLTTGGLPTFADISASFGGATVDEDSWIQQLVTVPPEGRGQSQKTKLAFVGDDTWVDLFPTQFDDSHPYPSFNTRDLDSVDNGCLEHLPRLLQNLKRESHPHGFEVIVAHFLGVDHVGHTYGPHNIHMDQKLRQMDAMLSAVFDGLDDEQHSCHAAFVFGDHGMTESGNHGGGTDDEINAALFAHFSPGCGNMHDALELTGAEAGKSSERAFQSIRQIDLVPTISVLLGLPIPYANLGGLVPSLLPTVETPEVALALALNAAQVWRYFTMYSKMANKLPSMSELDVLLQDAVTAYKEALKHDDSQDSIAFRRACGKIKLFLVEAADVGIRAWTRFDTRGMIFGGTIMLLAVLVGIPICTMSVPSSSADLSIPYDQYLEVAVTIALMLFQCVLLTFSNSYVDAEQHIIMFAQAVICLTVCTRCWPNSSSKVASVRSRYDKKLRTPGHRLWLVLAVPLCSRLGELFVLGHGLDPSIPLHVAHSPEIFVSALVALSAIRVYVHRKHRSSSVLKLAVDVTVVFFLALSWLEKRSPDLARNGFLASQMALGLLTVSIPLSVLEAIQNSEKQPWLQTLDVGIPILLFRLLEAIMAVTGPSTASSVLLFLIQAFVLYGASYQLNPHKISSLVLAALWRLTIRHTFFATNHACAFNRLQYSAAFVATEEFYFVTGGISLFLNTFGWEIVGLIAVSTTAYLTDRPGLWKTYCFFQLLETFGSCISVSIMRRHLMVWAIFAPRFIFAGVFLALNALGQIVIALANSKN